jgi:hypothetical protein
MRTMHNLKKKPRFDEHVKQNRDEERVKNFFR